MIISYKPGIEFLMDYTARIKDGDVKQIIFFLGTPADGVFLESLIGNFMDLHYLSGKHCICVSFVAPSGKQKYYKTWDGTSIDIPRFMDDNFLKAMTESSYQLASFFDISFKHLPCIVFVDPDDVDHFSFIRLHDKNVENVFSELRSLFSSWYVREKIIFRIHEVLKKDPLAKYPSEVQKIIQEMLLSKVIPKLKDSVFNSISNVHISEKKLMSVFNGLEKNPTDHIGINAHLVSKEEFKIYFDDFVFSSHHFSTGYLAIVRRSLKEAFPLPNFPVQKVDLLKTQLEIRHFNKRYLSKIFKFREIEIDLMSIFRFGMKRD